MKRNKNIITLLLVISSFLSSEDRDCDEGYTFIEELPETATILDGNSCLSNVDLDALTDLIEENGLDDDSTALEVGNQTWSDGRLRILQVSYSPNGADGVNTQLSMLPESFGNLSNLVMLYLEWNNLTSLPDSFSQLTNLINLTINNNWLTHLPEDIGNLSNLITLDLGYNQLSAIPASVCTMGSLTYLYLFNNNLTSLPDCMCILSIDWSGQDGGWNPYFGSGGNYLCSTVPDCIEASIYFESTLDQFYYSAILDAPQGCCTEDVACNYNENATVNNDCEYPGDVGTEYEGECDCNGNVEDCGGVCGGDAVEDCGGVCGGILVVDDCGECGGDNSGCDVSLSFGSIDGNSGTAEIFMQNNVPIAGFQFLISDTPNTLNIIDAYGGTAQNNEFLVSFNSDGTVIGFSLTGATITPGEEILIVIEFDYSPDYGQIELCLSEVIFAAADGTPLSVTVGDCETMAPYDECDVGDLNADSFYSVLDIVILANCVLAVNCLDLPNACAGDMNGDGWYNVLDIVLLANCILFDDCG